MPTYRYANPKEVNDRIGELRLAHSPLRMEIALRQALGIAYYNGRQWINVGRGLQGQSYVDAWNEEWDPQSAEVRMTDNKIGPLVRQIAARTNATKIEAGVSVPRHVRSMKCSRRASITQDIANASDDDVMMTRQARAASSLRWQTGCGIFVVQAASKSATVDSDIAANSDGSPIEINDQWVRWDVCPLTDLIWDVSNLSPDLRNHQTIILEKVLTVKQFEQRHGPLANHGIKQDDLGTIGELAPYYVQATAVIGASIFASYARMSQEKAIRVLYLLESDPQDPGRWPEMYVVIDPSRGASWSTSVDGKVVNMESPVNPYGSNGRNIFKLDGFRREDSVWAYGIPHVLMAQQDMANIAVSIEFQQLTAAVFGNWLVDQRSVSVETFEENLATGSGGVLKWNSHADNSIQPPKWVSPPPPNNEFILIRNDMGIGMRDQVHLTAADLGQLKSHVPENIQRMVMQESGVVLDNIVLCTIGTIRRCLEKPGRMLARLRDQYGLTAADLAEFLEMSPSVNEFTVRVRESAITSRSTDSRLLELGSAMQMQIITPVQYRATLAGELEHPLMADDERQLDFIKNQIVQTINGSPWVGLTSIEFGMFDYVVKSAIHGLDLTQPEDVQAMSRLEEALVIQMAIEQEKNGSTNGQPGMAGPPPNQPQEASLLPDQRGGPPESINPRTNPVGAAGGLPLGLG